MPVDLDLTPRNVGGPSGGMMANPLGLVEGIVGMRGQLLQQQQLQQEIQGRQAVGSAVSNAVKSGATLDQALDSVFSDPQAAAWGGPAYASYREGMLANQQLQNAQQSAAQSGLDVIYKGIGLSGGDLAKFDKIMEGSLATMSPAARARDARYVQDVRAALVPSDPSLSPQQRNEQFKANWLNMAISGKLMDPATLQALYPAAMGITPTTVTGAGGGIGVVSKPLGGQPTMGGLGEAPPTPPTTSAIAPDGKPLAAPSELLPKTTIGMNGLPYRSEEQQKSVSQLLGQFNERQPIYDAAAQTVARLDEVKNNISALAKVDDGKAWLKTGAAGNFRLNMANAVNTLYGMFNPGAKPPIDPTQLASAQALVKDTIGLGFQLVNQNFGGSREAMGVIENGIHAVPGIENTPLGGMLVADLLSASSNWYAAQRPFKLDWIQRAHGDLTGADAAYTSLHPPSELVEQVMRKYGIGAQGFMSAKDVIARHDEGLLSNQMTYEELHSHSWMSDGAFEAAKARGWKPSGGANQ